MKKYFLCTLFSALLKSFSQNHGDNIFNTQQMIHEVRITFPSNSWYDTLTHYYTVSSVLDSNIYLPATSVEFDGVVYDSVGCKFKGNSSYTNPSTKKSWKLSFEEFKDSNEVDGLKQLNLNNAFKDPSFMHEKLCLDFLEHYGVPAPRCDYANVYVNNQLWGFYTLVEEVDKTFCKTHFDSKKGNLFKGDPHGDLKWMGATPSLYYNDYELKTNNDVNDWSDLVWLLDNINNTPSALYNDSLDVSFNTSSYVKSWATTIMFSNLDSYTGSGHNYYIYHNIDSNRFEFINWDVNEAFGTFLNGNQLNGMSTLPMNYIPSQGNRPLHTKMLANSIYWNGFQNFVCNALADYFNPAFMDTMIDSLYTRIKPYVDADPRKIYGGNQFDLNLTSTQSNALGLKPFVQERYDYLTQQLISFNCTPLVSSIAETRDERLKIFPNPATDRLQITGYHLTDELFLYDIQGKILRREIPTESSFEIEVSNLQSGMYFLKLGEKCVKVVKD